MKSAMMACISVKIDVFIAGLTVHIHGHRVMPQQESVSMVVSPGGLANTVIPGVILATASRVLEMLTYVTTVTLGIIFSITFVPPVLRIVQ